MMSNSSFLVLCVCAILSGMPATQLQAREDAKSKTPPGLSATLDLRDGTHLVAKMPIGDRISLRAVFGKVSIPLRLIATIRFNEDRETVGLVFHNGDKLSGVPFKKAFRPHTCLGKLSIPRTVIKSITIKKAPLALGPPKKLFDGKSLAGWHSTPPWKVENGSILCPTTRSINNLLSKVQIHGPFELSYEIELLRLRRQDAKGMYIADPNGKGLAVVRLDDRPNTFHIRSGSKSVANVPLSLGKWYRIRCLVDDTGKLMASLNDSVTLTTTVHAKPPFVIGLQCERSGARFRNIVFREARRETDSKKGKPKPRPRKPPLKLTSKRAGVPQPVKSR